MKPLQGFLLLAFFAVGNGLAFHSGRPYTAEPIIRKLRSKRDVSERPSVLETGTDLCTPEQVSIAFRDSFDCESRAEYSVSKQLYETNPGSLFNAVCSLIEERIRCIEQHITPCLSAEQNNNLHFNTLSDEHEKALNNSNILGQAFINSCPPLRNYERDYPREVYGSEECTYEEILTLEKEFDICDGANMLLNNSRYHFALDYSSLLDSRIILGGELCRFYNEYFRCQNIILGCYSVEMKQKLGQEKFQEFAEWEKDLVAEGVVTNFSFEKCSTTV